MGLVDHHCHLLASAAKAASLSLHDIVSLDDLAERLGAATGDQWIRAINCPSILAETLTATMLDRLGPHRPVRIQDQTGALWVLNSAALNELEGELPLCVERDGSGAPTGRVWRGDAWLGQAIGRNVPELNRVGTTLARFGITAVTDASVTTDQHSAQLLADAHRSGDLPQRLTLMSAGRLEGPPDGAFAVGPVKILLDERALPPVDEVVERIALARHQNRAVAVHCVTATELAVTLAAFDQAGSRSGDRIEHGNVIPTEAIGVIRRLGLTIVVQPGWIATRGDRYLLEVDPVDQLDLLRIANLRKAGIMIAGGSDSPYGEWDCWAAMRAAVFRTTAQGKLLNPDEAIGADAALGLFRSAPDQPGGPARQIRAGEFADLCLIDGALPASAKELSARKVRATWIGGTLVHHSAICEKTDDSVV